MRAYHPETLFGALPSGLAPDNLAALMPAAVYACDAEGRLTFFNRQAVRIWGREPRLGDNQERFCGSFRMWTPDGTILKHEKCPMADALREGRSAQNMEVVIEQPSGDRLVADVNIEPILDECGRITGAVNVFVDVTDRKQNETLLAAQREALELALNGDPLDRSLGVLTRTPTTQYGCGVRGAFYLADADGRALQHVVGMPPEYALAVDGFAIGPDSLACGLAIHSGKPVLTTDVREEPLWKPWLQLAERFDIRGCWSFPIRSRQGEFVGTFALYWREPRTPAPRDMQYASLITQSAAIIISRWTEARRREAAEASLSAELTFMRSLHDLSTAALEGTDVTPVLESALDATMALHAADFGNIQMYDAATDSLEIAAQRGFDSAFLQRFARVDSREASACGFALRGRHRKIVTDIETDPDYALNRAVARAAGYRALQSTPLVSGTGAPLGMLSTHFRAPRRFTESEQTLTDLFAREVARAIERVRNQSTLRESEERFRQFAQASSGALWIRNANTLAMEYTSPAITTIYGVEPDALLGDLKRWAARIVPEDRSAALEHLECARRGESSVHEFRIRRSTDQAFRWIRDTDFPLFDDDGRINRIGGIGEDVTEAKLAVEHQGVLLAELQHRVRNILAMIRSVAARTMSSAESVKDYAELLTGRLMALARTQTLLTRAANVGVDIRTLVREELSAHANHESQYTICGPAVDIPPKAAEVLTLAIHELTTNAVKYGALSTISGKISVAWTVSRRNKKRKLRLEWCETRPPSLQWRPPARKGFGSELIERRVPYELGGRGGIEVRSDGTRAWIEFFLQGGDSTLQTGAPARIDVFGGSLDMTGEPSLVGQTVLILEDDFYLAQDAAAALESAGASVSGPFANEAAALRAVQEAAPSVAVIDINLGAGVSFAVGRALRRAKTPFVFLTGYDQSAIPREFAEVVRLQKPVELREIVRAVAASMNGSPIRRDPG